MSDERAFDDTLTTHQDAAVAEDPSGAYAVGEVLAGRYEVLACLGAGAMGEVYKVRDRQLDEVVALKRLTLTRSGEAAERFLREVKLGRRVTHRNVARTHDVGDHDGALFLTMELVEGQTLEDLVEARGGKLTIEEATPIVRQVLEGLAAAHDAGIVHRDLKPANVLVGADGRVALTDFGIARAAAEPGLTRAQQLLGTPIYMAPEQVLGRAVDHRADLYAFGVMLFELCTGRWPFTGETAIELALARCSRDPEDPRAAGIPDPMAEVVTRCLAREPSGRPSSARRVLELLDGGADERKHTTGTRHLAAPLADQLESLAVLPFAYRGPADDDYLGTGLAEELVDVLGRIRGLRVLAFSATSALGAQADPTELAPRLGVAHVVSGTVQLRGRDLRITARLVDADGTQRWSDRFSGVVEDLFELQESMSRRIAEALRLELGTHSHGQRLPQEAVERYFRARRRILRDGYAEVDGPLDDLERCIELAPSFGPAYALHAAASARSWFTSTLLRSSTEAGAKAKASVERALEAAPDHPDTYLAQGILALQELEHGRAAASFVRALELAPTLALAQAYLGAVQMEIGHTNEAIRRLTVAADLDPVLIPFAHVLLARIAFFEKDWLGYERHLERCGSFDDGGPRYFVEVRVALWRNDLEALGRLVDAPDLRRSHLQILIDHALGRVSTEDSEQRLKRFLATIDNPRLRQLVRQLTVESFGAMGQVASAERYLEALMSEPFVDIAWLDHCPALACLRERPSFRQAREKIAARAREVLSRDLAATRTWS
ncbi:MAG: protein kinase [Myxococcales bacterium]|nr:protein kinase [Myxococcales bacterium]